MTELCAEEFRERARHKRLKILYIQLATASFAGIERVVDDVCCALMDDYGDRFDIDVLYAADYKDQMPHGRGYNAISVFAPNTLSLLFNARRIIARTKYDLIVVPQVEPTVLYWLSSLGLKRRLVMHLHGNPKMEATHLKAKIMFFIMRHVVLDRLTSVFGTSPKQLESFRTAFPNKLPHYWVPNPVREFAHIGGGPASDPDCTTFVNVGRFAYQKGQDILIDAFAKLYSARQDVRLKLVGYGANEAALRDQIARLGLEGVAGIEHHPANPKDALSASDVYVSTSRWEGWSLAICEALRFGLPVVATDCDFGPSDILIDQRLGRLVPTSDADALVAAMHYYCDNLKSEKRDAAYRQAYIDRFSLRQVSRAHADALRMSAKGARPDLIAAFPGREAHA